MAWCDARSLTTGSDNYAGTSGDDTITAGEVEGVAAFTVGDQINGGAGNDTLNWVQTNAVDGLPTGASVQNVETANVTSGGDITLDTTSSFEGLTALNTNTSGDDQDITAGAETDVTANASAQAATAVAVDGGKDVTVNATGTTTGTTTVGAAAAAAGAVDVNLTTTLADGAADTTQTTGAVNITGGTSVSVSETATVTGGSNDALDALTQADVTVTGDANTTDVTVEQTAAQTQVTGAAGTGRAAIANGDVVVNDVNAASATDAGVIETVTLSSFGASSINSSALNTVNLSGTGTSLNIGRGALTATPTENTLTLNVDGLTTTGAITDVEAGGDDGFTTIELAASGEDASSIATLNAGDMTALNVSGEASVSIGTLTAANVETITSTSTGGVSIGNVLGNDVTFTGAAGDDSIILGANTNATEMGAGDDTVQLNNANLGAGGSVNGGEGNDTLVANVDGSAFIADPAVSGFETLRVAGVAAEGSHNANGFTALEIGITNAATTFTSVAAGTGLSVLAAPTGLTTVTMANATGEDDAFDLTFASEGAIDYSTNGVSIADVETINITSTDTETGDDAVAHTNALNLTANAAESIVVTGNAGLDLTGSTYANVTSFDASGIQGEADDAAALGVTFVSGNTTVGAEVTITGGAGEDSLTGSASANDTINGGAGDDTLVYTGGADSFTGGAGNDTFDINNVGTKTSFLTITETNVGDKIDFVGVTTAQNLADANVGDKITLGAAATFDQYLDAAAAGDGATANAQFAWFQSGGDTYAVIDNSAGATFVDTADSVIKLTGMVDLSDSAIATEVLTIA